MKRVTGQTVGQFLRADAQPADLDFLLGVPEDQHSRIINVIPIAPPKPAPNAQAPPPSRDMAFVAKQLADRNSVTFKSFFIDPSLADPQAPNSARWRVAQIPAANGHANARGIMRLYESMASSDLVSLASAEQSSGIDEVLGIHTRFH